MRFPSDSDFRDRAVNFFPKAAADARQLGIDVALLAASSQQSSRRGAARGAAAAAAPGPAEFSNKAAL